MTRILDVSKFSKDSVIKEAVQALQSGGLVVFPTDTVYGLLVDATNDKAVHKLIKFKNRPPGKAISVLVADMEMLNKQLRVTSEQRNLLEEMLPGPFTVILPSRHKVVKELESEKGTLGVRIPDNDFVLSLAREFGKPVTATSANLGGRSPHYSVSSLLNQISQEKEKFIDLIVDGGKLPRNKPSTVIDLTTDQMTVLRQGDMVFDDSQSFFSKSPEQTRKVGEFVAEKVLASKHDKPTVVILKGDLGVGKTEMTRSIASCFGIEKVVSPTYVVYYEYDILVSSYESESHKLQSKDKSQEFNKFIHVDLYNVQDEEEFEHLGLEDYLKEKNVIVIEWGEKLGKLYETFKEKADVVFVEVEYEGEGERKIKVQSQSSLA